MKAAGCINGDSADCFQAVQGGSSVPAIAQIDGHLGLGVCQVWVHLPQLGCLMGLQKFPNSDSPVSLLDFSVPTVSMAACNEQQSSQKAYLALLLLLLERQGHSLLQFRLLNKQNCQWKSLTLGHS